mmetsp:Transcript_22764/g.46616  ORF Transcript_22764/g.46616 Transcript_22764/m.46616 type:complete len:237 (+) Transcript_22764:927-1637(+)
MQTTLTRFAASVNIESGVVFSIENFSREHPPFEQRVPRRKHGPLVPNNRFHRTAFHHVLLALFLRTPLPFNIATIDPNLICFPVVAWNLTTSIISSALSAGRNKRRKARRGPNGKGGICVCPTLPSKVRGIFPCLQHTILIIIPSERIVGLFSFCIPLALFFYFFCLPAFPPLSPLLLPPSLLFLLVVKCKRSTGGVRSTRISSVIGVIMVPKHQQPFPWQQSNVFHLKPLFKFFP